MLLSWKLLPETGFLLHAATVIRNGEAYVFFGRSGAGKSTVASLSPSGSVFTDEISLLKRVDGEWRAFGTPFWGEFRADGTNCSAPLAGMFRLLQSPENRVESLGPAELVKALLPCVLFFSSRVDDHQRLLEILASTSREVSGYNLQFQKNRSFWEVIPS
jgi:energy-coupling factor transporter ATP-binding protein EcfA2